MRSCKRRRESERGFTLAAVLVILTVMMIFIAYTVPQMWSDVLRRERDHQTIWTMKQYARAIAEFQKQRKALPVSLDQLKEQNTPRVLRKLYANPLSGEVDWILIAPGTEQGTPPPGGQPPPGSTTPAPVTPPGVDSTKGGAGPFIGVRPPQKGDSFVTFNERTTYETWTYTITDLQRDLNPAAPGGANPPPPK